MPLPQPLLIFRKDLRHLWPETLLVLVLFAAFAWAAPSGWTTSQYASFAPILSGFLKMLMPIAWLVLISRLVHDESLVGDRQFWTSRPYHWAKLLAAKLLYLAVFLYLPFLLMQVFLLLRAGLHPMLSLPALLYNLLLLTVVIVVPVTALAAVTATFARLLLSALGALLYVVILGIAFAFLARERMPPPLLGPVLTAIFILLPATALVYQYATRRTAQARLLLAVTPLLIVGLLLVTPAAALIRHAYPAAAGPSEPKLTSLPPNLAPHSPDPGKLVVVRNEVLLTLPFAVDKVDKNSTYLLQGAALTLEAQGRHVETPYTSVSGQFDDSQPVAVVNLPLSVEAFNAVKSNTAEVHFSLAAEHIQSLPAQIWKATLQPFAVPGNGLCTFPSAAQLDMNPAAGPLCRYPFKVPQLNLVQAPIAFGACGNGTTVEGFGALGGAPELLAFDPVITAPLNLRPRQQALPGTTFTLCPGTPLSFTEAKSQGRTRFEIDEKQLVLDNYAVRQRPMQVPAELPSAPQ